jgi:serine/threonine protein phosphatase PrpC
MGKLPRRLRFFSAWILTNFLESGAKGMKKKRRKFRQKNTETTPAVAPAFAPPLVGNPSTFSTKAWWSSDWWNLAANGANNDIVSDFGTYGDLALAAASIRGNSHRLAGTRCEDSFCITTGETLNEAPFLVAVIGDGLGSAKYSAYGSKKTTYLFAKRLVEGLSKKEELTQPDIGKIASGIIGQIKKDVQFWSQGEHLAPYLSSEEVPPNHLETTLTFAVIPTRDNQETRTVFFGQIGDSPIFVLSGGKWQTVSRTIDDEPDQSDSGDEAILDSTTQGFQGTESLLIGSKDLLDSEVLLLATDGVGNFILSGEEPLAAGNYFANEWRQPPPELKFINDLTFDFSTADDDRTAVVCWFNRRQFDSDE